MLGFIMLAGIVLGGMELFGKGKIKPSEWFGGDVAQAGTGLGGLEVKQNEEQNSAFSLMSFAIPIEMYDAYGIMPIADSAQVLTATVKPDNLGTNTQAIWTAEFLNPASAWAQGKSVGDYISLAYGNEIVSSKQCTVTCLAPFGEPINIKVSIIGFPDINATARADYRQRMTDYSLRFGDVSCEWGRSTEVTWELGDETNGAGGMASLTPVTADTYTLPVDYTVKYSLSWESSYTDPLVVGSGSMSNSVYIGFETNSSSVTSPQTTKFDIASYDVSSKGLYFGAKYMYDNMGLNGYTHFMNSYSTGQMDYALLRNYILQGYNNTTTGQYTYWTLNKHLFRLTVSVTCCEQTMEKWTTFTISGYNYTIPITGVELNNSSIIF